MPVPTLRLTDPAFVWVPPANTDVRRTFRKHGWVGPEEKRTLEGITVKNLSEAETTEVMQFFKDFEATARLEPLPHHRLGD